jgi:flagellar motor switch protein FliM
MICNPNDNERPALRRLVQAARMQPTPAQAEPVSEYDWKSPGGFTASQIRKLLEAAGEVAAELSRALGGLLKTELKLAAGTVVSRYGADLGAGSPQGGSVLVALGGDDKRRCGWIEMPRATAGDWVARLLGGRGGASGAEARELSPLERTLLADVFAASSAAVSTVLRKLGARPVRCQAAAVPGGDTILGGLNLAPEEQPLEYCRISFLADGKACCDLILLGDWLAPLAAQGVKETPLPPAEAQKHLLEHLSQAAVEATAQLGAATVLVQDVVSLEEGDVLVMETRLGDEIVLEVQGNAVLKAVPAFSDGCYALRVTEVIRQEPHKNPSPSAKA